MSRSVPGGDLAGRTQEISRYLTAAHRHPDQAAHLGACGRKARRQAIGQGVGQGQGYGDFPENGVLG